MRDRSTLISKLVRNREARESYIRSKLNVLLPSQIRGLRLQRDLKQEELGQEADMKQSRISAMERPGEVGFNIDTLIRLAAALRVGLKVEFVPFSDMVKWENQYSQDSFTVVPIEADSDFIQPPEVARERAANPAAITALLASSISQGQTVELRPPGIPIAQFRNPLYPEGLNEAIGGYSRTSAGLR